MEKPSECWCCEYETDKLEFYENKWLCDICAGSLIAYHVQLKMLNEETTVLLKTLAYLTNVIINK